jgi:polyphosphate glucokinase
MDILGIDIGGSGIKGAPVDVTRGVLTAERQRIPTPEPSAPEAVGAVVAEIVKRFKWKGPVGCTFPAVTKNGMTYSAANVDKGWIDFEAEKFLRKKTGVPLRLVNDADAAGLAEAAFGAARGVPGVVIMLTLGTGIGSALLLDGKLVPNTEFGHLEIRGKDAEKRASDATRMLKDLSWEKWAERLNELLARLERYFSPDLVIIGGGGSKRYDKFGQYLHLERGKIVPGQLLNEAGIIGAALAAKDLEVTTPKAEKAARPVKKKVSVRRTVKAAPKKKPAGRK